MEEWHDVDGVGVIVKYPIEGAQEYDSYDERSKKEKKWTHEI